jgi:superfamily II DNA/RNA helicase
MTHHVFSVAAQDRPAVIRELAGGRDRSLLFTRTKHTAQRLARQLTASGVPAVDLHGNLSQKKRERNLAAFADGSVRVLVATDIAARGIHVDDVALVVHVDPPAEHKAYLHRSGRTARAGAGGAVVTVITAEQEREVRTLAKQAGIRPVTASVGPGAPQIAALTGPPASHVQPAAAAPDPARAKAAAKVAKPGRPKAVSGHPAAAGQRQFGVGRQRDERGPFSGSRKPSRRRRSGRAA